MLAITVSDDQLDQFFQFIKNMQLEEVISEPLTILHSYSLSILSLDNVMQLCRW